MNDLSLPRIAMELLQINENFYCHVENPRKTRITDFQLKTFDQLWGNTSGGFEGFGGSAMTTQRTYVFIPNNMKGQCLVYFGGKFAYSVPYSNIFINDVLNDRIEGMSGKSKYDIKE